MLSKEERDQLKAQEREFQQKAKEHREELKELNAEQKKAAKEQKADKGKLPHTPKKARKNVDQKKILSVFPIRDYRNDFFITVDDQIIDLFQIQGHAYYDTSDEEIENLVYGCDKFLQKYAADFKIISMNYPTNTKQQQKFLTFEMQRPELQQFEDMISEKLAALKNLEQSTTEREAFIMVFAKAAASMTSFFNCSKKAAGTSSGKLIVIRKRISSFS